MAPLTLMLAALTALTALSIDMSLPAIPEFQRVFAAAPAEAQLTLSLFLAGFAFGQLFCGPLSDRLGRRPVLLAGLSLFSLAGLACALSPSLGWLLFGRFLQGLGASVGPVVARAIVRDSYDAESASSVLSQIVQVMIVAPLVAPTLGGYLLVEFGWPSVFVALGLGGALLGFVCWRSLPETSTGQGGASALAGLRSLLTHRQSLRHVLCVCAVYAGMFAYVGGSPLVLMDVFGVSERHFGAYFAVTAASLLVSATLNRALLKRHVPSSTLLRWGVRIVLVSGLLLPFTMGFGLAGVLVPMMGYLFGQGLLMPNATAAAMAPHGRSAGVVSSAIGFLQTAGGALTGYLVGHFYNGTPLSLAVIVALFAGLTYLAHER